MIDRKRIIEAFSPTTNEIDYQAPFTLGNGSFGFTADVTGLQTLYDDYDGEGGFPLCSLSQWGWNRHYFDEGIYPSRDSLQYTEYITPIDNRLVKYPVEAFSGNERLYDWFRKNPHRCNLYRMGFLYKNKPIPASSIIAISQTLDLYRGKLISRFKIGSAKVQVETFVSQLDDSLCVKIDSEVELQLCLEFPYSSWKKNGSDWASLKAHRTVMDVQVNKKRIAIERYLNDFTYHVMMQGDTIQSVNCDPQQHRCVISVEKKCQFVLTIAEDRIENVRSFSDANHRSISVWKDFWENTGFVDVTNSEDSRAEELQRRIILSKYLLQIQSNASMPPQETGLSCNSWYGKFHLEMHLWHIGYLSTWNQGNDLKKNLLWYSDHLAQAKENAARNGYQGARWPKMIGNDGMDSPSQIAPLLIWQQTHIIYLMDQLCCITGDTEYLMRHFNLIEETMAFVCSFLVYDERQEKYIIQPPVMPSQEVFEATAVFNPTFELEYWYFSIKAAIKLGEKLNKNVDEWKRVLQHLASVDEQFDFYPAYQEEGATFKNFNRDHPSFIGIFGLINESRMNPVKVEATLNKVLSEWQYDELWGWDFAMLAMVATKLKQPQKAIDILLSNTHKNQYLMNGHNFQKLTTNPKNYLPVYLPGNGSLLLAISLMVSKDSWGFPKDKWMIKKENMNEWPYL